MEQWSPPGAPACSEVGHTAGGTVLGSDRRIHSSYAVLKRFAEETTAMAGSQRRAGSVDLAFRPASKRSIHFMSRLQPAAQNQRIRVSQPSSTAPAVLLPAGEDRRNRRQDTGNPRPIRRRCAAIYVWRQQHLESRGTASAVRATRHSLHSARRAQRRCYPPSCARSRLILNSFLPIPWASYPM